MRRITVTILILVGLVMTIKAQTQQMVITTNNGTEITRELSDIAELELKQNNLITKTTEGRSTLNLYSIDKITFGFSTGIDESVAQRTMKIFPNPVNDSFTLSNTSEEINEITIYSIEGIKAGTYQIESSTKTLNISHLNPGIYFIAAGKETIKFIKL